MHEQFRRPQLQALGYTGTSADMWKKWLNDQGFPGPIVDAEMRWFDSQGIKGSINDRYYALYRAAGLTGALDDMGKYWEIDDGPPVDPGNDPMWDQVWFFNSMKSLTDPALPASDNGEAVQTGTEISVEATGPFGQSVLNFVPTANVANNLTYGRDATTLDTSEGFTVDMWLNISSGGIVAAPVILELLNTNDSAVSALFAAPRVTRAINFAGMGSTLASQADVFTENQWFHFAYVFSGTDSSLYINGVRVFQGVNTIVETVFDSVVIASRPPGAPRPIRARFADVRITKGVRYTGASFPIPTEAVIPPTTP